MEGPRSAQGVTPVSVVFSSKSRRTLGRFPSISFLFKKSFSPVFFFVQKKQQPRFESLKDVFPVSRRESVLVKDDSRDLLGGQRRHVCWY